MDHELMTGMLWGGILLMSFPVLLGIGIGVFVLHRYRAERRSEPGPDNRG